MKSNQGTSSVADRVYIDRIQSPVDKEEFVVTVTERPA